MVSGLWPAKETEALDMTPGSRFNSSWRAAALTRWKGAPNPCSSRSRLDPDHRMAFLSRRIQNDLVRAYAKTEARSMNPWSGHARPGSHIPVKASLKSRAKHLAPTLKNRRFRGLENSSNPNIKVAGRFRGQKVGKHLFPDRALSCSALRFTFCSPKHPRSIDKVKSPVF